MGRCIMNRKTTVGVSLFLLLCLLLAGCGRRITAEEIVSKMQETVDSTRDAHAVVTAEINAQGIEMRAKAEIWEKMPNKMRAVILEASEPQHVGTVMVSDGEQAWHYEPGRNQVTVGAIGEVETSVPQEMLNSMQGAIQEVLDSSEVTLEGEEEVAGRLAYKLALSPKEDAEVELLPGGGTATLWVDKQEWFILRAHFEASAFGQGEMEVESFELNPGLSDDLFYFEVPEGVEVVDVASRQVENLSLDEARSEAPFPLLMPEYVPEGTTLVDVFRAGDTYVLSYDHSPQISFTVVQGGTLPGTPPFGAPQEVPLRGTTAKAVTDEAGGNTFLYWTEGDVTIAVAGHIGLDEALSVAESLQ
jgi:outer membrane lipoprotein-sorting protein